MADDESGLVIEEADDAMEKSIRSLRRDLQKVRTGRASTALLDGLQVDYFGTATPLNQLANLSAPDPRLLVVNPYDKSAIGAIERAIQRPATRGERAQVGLSPSSSACDAGDGPTARAVAEGPRAVRARVP